MTRLFLVYGRQFGIQIFFGTLKRVLVCFSLFLSMPQPNENLTIQAKHKIVLYSFFIKFVEEEIFFLIMIKLFHTICDLVK